jgi:O-antigen ligase
MVSEDMDITQRMESSWIGKVIVFWWFIKVFKPEWIVSHFNPALTFLKPLPTILTIFLLICLIGSRDNKKQYDKSILFFLVVTFISTVFSSNQGMSINILRQATETFIGFAVMMTFISSEKDINRFFMIYLFSFVAFGIWGISEGGLVIAFMPLENEDSFGPFMCMGASFAYFMHLMYERSLVRKAFFLVFLLCVLGVIVSFARGAFLSLLSLLIYIGLRCRNKIKVLAAACMLVAVFMLMPSRYITSYEDEMGTIWELGTAEQTAHDRIYLWTKAWEMFVDNPLVGVGPNCYGFRLPRYSDREDTSRWGVRHQTYGRVAHSMFFQVMADMGSLGVLSLVVILVYFWKKNRLVRRVTEEMMGNNNSARDERTRKGSDMARRYYYYALSVESAMVTFLANSIFYDLLYFAWFWDILILNVLIYNNVEKRYGVSQEASSGKGVPVLRN